MAISAGLCNSFKLELVGGGHDLLNDTIELALFTNSATLSPTTTAYATTGEVSTDSGYTAGGETVVLTAAFDSSNNLKLSTSNIVFASVSGTIGGALLYNASNSNKAIGVWRPEYAISTATRESLTLDTLNAFLVVGG